MISVKIPKLELEIDQFISRPQLFQYGEKEILVVGVKGDNKALDIWKKICHHVMNPQDEVSLELKSPEIADHVIKFSNFEVLHANLEDEIFMLHLRVFRTKNNNKGTDGAYDRAMKVLG